MPRSLTNPTKKLCAAQRPQRLPHSTHSQVRQPQAHAGDGGFVQVDRLNYFAFSSLIAVQDHP
jgi:hypothetical protein